ncbi:hypothetical protein ACSQ67_009132 [Phaseolus vulgaris]
MHDMIRSMGKEIVREQSTLPHKRNRLWLYEDIVCVLEKNMNSKVLRQLILRGCKNIRRIPDMSGFPNLKELCVGECTNLIEIHDSVGSLLNLQKFCAEGCTKLTIGPSRINLISLEHLCLRDCSSLVMFPEVLAPMQKLKHVDLGGTAIENLPLSMQNLEGLQMLSLGKCNMLEMNESSNFFQNLQTLFPNLSELYVRDLDITILPACIEECDTLEFRHLYNCSALEQIREPSLSINEFSAAHSPVIAHSLTLKLRQVIDSAAMRIFVLPGRKIPKLFDHSSMGNSLSFWFRKELPYLAVCAIIGVWENVKPPFVASSRFHVKLNDIYTCVCCFCGGNIIWTTEDSHIIILNRQNDFQHALNSDIQRALLTNEWIPGKILLRIEQQNDSSRLGKIEKTGVYVNRTFSRVEDVRFKDPYNKLKIN